MSDGKVLQLRWRARRPMLGRMCDDNMSTTIIILPYQIMYSLWLEHTYYFFFVYVDDNKKKKRKWK